MEISILISSHERLNLLRRTLWAISKKPPSWSFEVVLVDDGSEADILGELRQYSHKFEWTFIRVDKNIFEEKTGIRPFFNCPAWTNNVGFRHAKGKYIVLQGNEVLPTHQAYDRLYFERPDAAHPARKSWLVNTTTYDVPLSFLALMDNYGTQLDNRQVEDKLIEAVSRWPLQSSTYHSDVPNYLSLSPRELWERTGGFDERYLGGISAEDSDWVRRCRTIENFSLQISPAVSLHQAHRGKTRYSNPPPTVITKQRWDEGVSKNHALYALWDGRTESGQSWPMGEVGVVEVVKC